MTEQEMMSKYGMPDTTLNASNYKSKSARIIEDVCEEYAIYFSFSASGGCIVLGKTQSDEWIPNPNLRWPVMALAKKAI